MTTSTPKTKDLNEKSRNSQFRMVSLKLSTQWTIVPGRLNSKFCAWGVKGRISSRKSWPTLVNYRASLTTRIWDGPILHKIIQSSTQSCHTKPCRSFLYGKFMVWHDFRVFCFLNIKSCAAFRLKIDWSLSFAIYPQDEIVYEEMALSTKKMTGSLSGSTPETHWFVSAIEDVQYELFT